MDDIISKKKEIYNNIMENNINHNIIIDFISKYNIKYSKNNNGFFFNISILDKNIVDELYEIILSNINLKDKDINRADELDKIKKDIKINKGKKKTNIEKIIKKEYIKIPKLTSNQIKLIQHSKTI